MVFTISSDEEFGKLFLSDGFAAVNFVGKSLDGSDLVASDFEKLEKKYPNFKCFQVDADELEMLAMSFQATRMPITLFFSNGEMIERVGPMFIDDRDLEGVFEKCVAEYS